MPAIIHEAAAHSSALENEPKACSADRVYEPVCFDCGASVEGLSRVVNRVAHVCHHRHRYGTGSREGEERSGLHFHGEHAGVRMMLQLPVGFSVRRIGGPHESFKDGCVERGPRPEPPWWRAPGSEFAGRGERGRLTSGPRSTGRLTQQAAPPRGLRKDPQSSAG